MAIPALLGIPLLGGLLAGLFTSLFSFFAKYLTKRLALTSAFVALMIAATGAFLAVLEGIFAGLVLTLPVEYSAAMQLVVPDNLLPCMSAIIGLRLARYAYVWKMKVIQYRMNI